MKFKSLFSLSCTLLVATAMYAQDTVKGYVYEDLNQNGRKDRKEVGIQGVSVTNGVDVVQTDAKGRYKLSVGNDAIISVIKPSGYAINTNADQLAQFFYIHKPDGSPESDFEGVAPTGKLPRTLNFGLVATDG